jgi:hypothetical protein
VATSEYKKEALVACIANIRAKGFTKGKSRGPLMCERSPGVFGWVGLNTQNLPGLLRVNPVIGVRHIRLERALIELGENLTSPLPSVTSPLGYLTPKRTFLMWEFSPGITSGPVAAGLAEAIVEYGEPFIAKFADWKTFSAEAEEGDLIMANVRKIWFPVIRALNGNIIAARVMVEEEVSRLGLQEDAYSLGYRKFAEKFFRKFPIN